MFAPNPPPMSKFATRLRMYRFAFASFTTVCFSLFNKNKMACNKSSHSAIALLHWFVAVMARCWNSSNCPP